MCQKVGPIFESLKTAYEGKPIQFLKLDLTSRYTVDGAVKDGQRIGVKDIFDYNRSTGVIVLVNPDTMQAIDSFGSTHSEDDIRSAIDKAIGL